MHHRLGERRDILRSSRGVHGDVPRVGGKTEVVEDRRAAHRDRGLLVSGQMRDRRLVQPGSAIQINRVDDIVSGLGLVSGRGL